MEKLVQQLSITKQFYALVLLNAFSAAAVFALFVYLTRDAIASSAITAIGIACLLYVLLIGSFGWYVGRFNARRAETIVGAMSAMAKGDLTRRIEIIGRDEFAWLCWEYSQTRKGFADMVKSIKGHSAQLAAAADQLHAITEHANQGAVRQQSEVQQVASAMTQMSATVQEVALNAVNASDAAVEADDQAKAGHSVVNETVESINALAQEVQATSTVIERLKDDSVAIGAVLDVIRSIAKQTNLLALNAAIEAARAGEQGRGFAVVADEVRTLASRTQESTQEINDMIERLQGGANEAVRVMELGRTRTESTVVKAAKARDALSAITEVVDSIKAMNLQIASAAEEQSATAEEINRNIVSISDVADDNTQGAHQTATASQELAKLATQLQEQIQRFQVN